MPGRMFTGPITGSLHAAWAGVGFTAIGMAIVPANTLSTVAASVAIETNFLYIEKKYYGYIYGQYIPWAGEDNA
jgi:hypothetical protein